MNWPKRAFTNTQQAPGAVQSARLVPAKFASSSIHSITGTKARQSRNAITSVMTMSSGVANSFSRMVRA